MESNEGKLNGRYAVILLCHVYRLLLLLLGSLGVRRQEQSNTVAYVTWLKKRNYLTQRQRHPHAQ